MNNVFSEINSRRMLALTKAALHETDPDAHLFVNVTEKDWSDIFEKSASQGIIVWLLYGAMRLPKNLQPPLPVKLNWITRVETVEKWYRHCLEAANELSAFFRENNIRMLLFKGVALARLYPVPSARPFGDIDIFLCGKSKEGNVLLEQLTAGKSIGKISDKHSGFHYKKIWIENHHTFLNQDGFLNAENLEKVLMTMLEEAGITGDSNSAVSLPESNALLFPPPDFDALFVTLHTIGHFKARIVLRQLCDLTVLFTAYKGKLNFPRYNEALSNAGLLKTAGALIALCVRHLGLKPEYAPPYTSDAVLEERIWNDILNPEIPLLAPEKRNLLNVIGYKLQLLRTRRWKSELVFPGQYGKRIVSSIRFHLRNPKAIRKVIT